MPARPKGNTRGKPLGLNNWCANFHAVAFRRHRGRNNDADFPSMTVMARGRPREEESRCCSTRANKLFMSMQSVGNGATEITMLLLR